MTTSTPVEMKRVMGGSAYAIVGILTALKMTPCQGRMIGPDGEQEDSVIVMAVGNGRQAGGGIQITPKALLNDGLLDVMFVRDFPGVELGTVLTELQDLDNPDNRFVYYRQMPFVQIEGQEEGPINLDGEPRRWKSIRFDVLPGALSAIIPADAPLLKG